MYMRVCAWVVKNLANRLTNMVLLCSKVKLQTGPGKGYFAERSNPLPRSDYSHSTYLGPGALGSPTSNSSSSQSAIFLYVLSLKLHQECYFYKICTSETYLLNKLNLLRLSVRLFINGELWFSRILFKINSLFCFDEDNSQKRSSNVYLQYKHSPSECLACHKKQTSINV